MVGREFPRLTLGLARFPPNLLAGPVRESIFEFVAQDTPPDFENFPSSSSLLVDQFVGRLAALVFREDEHPAASDFGVGLDFDRVALKLDRDAGE